MESVFSRFDRVEIGESSAAEVLSFIQDESLGEMLSQDEQTVVSWAQNGNGAVIWLNVVSFDEASNTAARKYAFLVDEDSPGWRLFYGSKSKKMRAEFEFVLPPEFDELELTTENERKREALKTALNLYIKDIDVVRYDSDYIYSSAMMLRQTFNELLYELERVPAKLSKIDEPEGVSFDHPTLGPSRVRMLFDTETYIVRIKIKVGKCTTDFDEHKDVVLMGDPSVKQNQIEKAKAQAAAEEEKEKEGWIDWINNVQPKKQQRSAEELQRIEDMANQRAAEEIKALEAEQAEEAPAVDESEQQNVEEMTIEPETLPQDNSETTQPEAAEEQTTEKPAEE
ncbi:MAG: hypothetical protein ACIAQZ_13180 [Sedimentisphaeraceae bacterium JB056]